MMYHSYIVVETGNNPDRPRPGRRWIGNIYNIHQRLSMGFPNNNKLSTDKDFLDPFKPEYFITDCNTPSDHNIEKSESNSPKFLYRIENVIHGNESKTIVCVQSEEKPNWAYAFHNAGMLVSYYSEAMEYKPEFGEGDLMKFRISINLSKKSNEYCKSGEIRQKSGKEQSKRVALTWEKEKDRDTEILAWFNNKAIHNGFKVNDLQVVNVGWKYLWKNQEKLKTLKFRSALLEGRLTVTDRYVMLNTIQSGLGSAKAFGFGLLSVKKLNF